MPLAALVMYKLKSDDLAVRMFAGEVIWTTLGAREVAVAVAKRQLFVVAVLGVPTLAHVDLARELRDRVGNMLVDPSGVVDPPPPPTTSGGGGSRLAELQLVELGITVGRQRARA